MDRQRKSYWPLAIRDTSVGIRISDEEWKEVEESARFNRGLRAQTQATPKLIEFMHEKVVNSLYLPFAEHDARKDYIQQTLTSGFTPEHLLTVDLDSSHPPLTTLLFPYSFVPENESVLEFAVLKGKIPQYHEMKGRLYFGRYENYSREEFHARPALTTLLPLPLQKTEEVLALKGNEGWIGNAALIERCGLNDWYLLLAEDDEPCD
ncbi:hypothetical protein FJZ18_03945 [Candidatus Pacearchaeota archaeon]|nr:hypothetical protein [Candidatus Pacearchaeota archaeon]